MNGMQGFIDERDAIRMIRNAIPDLRTYPSDALPTSTLWFYLECSSLYRKAYIRPVSIGTDERPDFPHA